MVSSEKFITFVTSIKVMHLTSLEETINTYTLNRLES